MGARVPVSGVNNEALTAPATDMREVISGLDPPAVGMVFWLRWLLIANEHASSKAVVEIADQAEAAITAANQRGVIHVPPGESVMVDFPEPGMKFVTNLTAAVTGGTIATNGGISGGGYLE